tara:strand:- start:1477 stop:1989 length:513 start_codon:yes stop_codon:yes gene_type:complete
MKIEELDQPQEWKDEFQKFADNPTGFLLLAGKNGTGKTTSTEAIYQNARIRLENPQHDTKIFFTQVDLFMKWTKDQKRWGDTSYLCDQLTNVRLLVLDDLGTRSPSDAYKDFLYAIIEKRERYKHLLGTIITTNLNSEQMRDSFGDAIISRACSGKVFKFVGEDRRFKEF